MGFGEGCNGSYSPFALCMEQCPNLRYQPLSLLCCPWPQVSIPYHFFGRKTPSVDFYTVDDNLLTIPAILLLVSPHFTRWLVFWLRNNAHTIASLLICVGLTLRYILWVILCSHGEPFAPTLPEVRLTNSLTLSRVRGKLLLDSMAPHTRLSTVQRKPKKRNMLPTSPPILSSWSLSARLRAQTTNLVNFIGNLKSTLTRKWRSRGSRLQCCPLFQLNSLQPVTLCPSNGLPWPSWMTSSIPILEWSPRMMHMTWAIQLR